jgi:hypothetical protein
MSASVRSSRALVQFQLESLCRSCPAARTPEKPVQETWVHFCLSRRSDSRRVPCFGDRLLGKFDSYTSDQKRRKIKARVCPLPFASHGEVAQLGEHLFCTEKRVGSTPTFSTITRGSTTSSLTACNSVVRVPLLQRGSRKFDPCHADQSACIRAPLEKQTSSVLEEKRRFVQWQDTCLICR